MVSSQAILDFLQPWLQEYSVGQCITVHCSVGQCVEEQYNVANPSVFEALVHCRAEG